MPWTRRALRGALIGTAVAALAALAGGIVRILPWLLDPSVTWRVAAPFARSLAVIAGEAALAVGWPVGWALATQGFVERGEARVLRLLGERPLRTTARLAAHGLCLAVALGATSLASAVESTEPGRIVTELIQQGQAACRNADAPRTYVVPFFGATWLCAPGRPPRLAGQGPGRLSALVFSATDARASGDLARLDLDDAFVAFSGFSLHVGHLTLSGVTPWGHASSVKPWPRALALTIAVGLSSGVAVTLLLLSVVAGKAAWTPNENVPPLGETTWYWSKNDSLLPALAVSSDCMVAMAVSTRVRKVLPISNDAGTSASVLCVEVPSSKPSETRDCWGVLGSAVAPRKMPGDTSCPDTSLPPCASGPNRPAMSAWKSPAAKGTSVWKLTHSTDSMDWPVESMVVEDAPVPVSPVAGGEPVSLQT